MKICKNCLQEKPLEEFYINSSKCKTCARKISAQYHLTHKEQRSSYAQKYSKANRERINALNRKREANLSQEKREKLRKKNQEEYQKHKEKYLRYGKQRYATMSPEEKLRTIQLAKKWRKENWDRVKELKKIYKQKPINKIYRSLSRALVHRLSRQLLRGIRCQSKEFQNNLESKFQTGMSWDNYGEWHIDHIKPLASFDLSVPEQILAANHYTNLQPLWARDNIAKGNKLDWSPQDNKKL